eukprot:m.542813 g.542813  ORF g.542813 m.542813 type:complete len:311 (-) comp22121_c0_seq2:2660-3592(-)
MQVSRPHCFCQRYCGHGTDPPPDGNHEWSHQPCAARQNTFCGQMAPRHNPVCPGTLLYAPTGVRRRQLRVLHGHGGRGRSAVAGRPCSSVGTLLHRGRAAGRECSASARQRGVPPCPQGHPRRPENHVCAVVCAHQPPGARGLLASVGHVQRRRPYTRVAAGLGAVPVLVCVTDLHPLADDAHCQRQRRCRCRRGGCTRRSAHSQSPFAIHPDRAVLTATLTAAIAPLWRQWYPDVPPVSSLAHAEITAATGDPPAAPQPSNGTGNAPCESVDVSIDHAAVPDAALRRALHVVMSAVQDMGLQTSSMEYY